MDLKSKIYEQKLYVKNIIIKLEEYFLQHKDKAINISEEEASDLMNYVYLLEEYLNG